MFLGLDYLVKGEWKRAKESISNINLFFQRGSGAWKRYLEFKADWERVMGKVQEEGINEILKECWV